jgi:DNA (cytosine-5)-methyltransferase 1
VKILDLFSGVGMFSYGLHKLGWETAAFVEIDPWCRRVLAERYPGVPIYEDVCEVTYERIESAGITGIDIICGGFPCQDLSVAGKQAGITASRSGLWGEFARIISEVRPRYVIVENVSALLTGDSGAWMRRVLGDLAEIGYDAEWHVIPAGNPKGLSAGAPHRRDRVWIVAYPNNTGDTPQGCGTDTNRAAQEQDIRQQPQLEPGRQGNDVGNTKRKRQPRQGQPVKPLRQETQEDWQTDSAESVSERGIRPTQSSMGLLAHGLAIGLSRSRWLPEPGTGRVATGVPDRVNKLKALGNGLVWQIPYAIGKSIMDQT